MWSRSPMVPHHMHFDLDAGHLQHRQKPFRKDDTTVDAKYVVRSDADFHVANPAVPMCRMAGRIRHFPLRLTQSASNGLISPGCSHTILILGCF